AAIRLAADRAVAELIRIRPRTLHRERHRPAPARTFQRLRHYFFRFAVLRLAVLRLPVAFFGTFLPSLRASDRPMAIACLRLFTLPPLPPFPLFSVPLLNFFISRSTSLPALLAYFLAMGPS